MNNFFCLVSLNLLRPEFGIAIKDYATWSLDAMWKKQIQVCAICHLRWNVVISRQMFKAIDFTLYST